MHPSRPSKEPPSGPSSSQGGGQDQDIHSIWDSLGRLRSELRRMKHRLDDATETGAPLSVTAAVEAISSGASGLHNHHSHLHHHMQVDQTHGNDSQIQQTFTDKANRLPGGHSSSSTSVPSRRKVSRLDSKGEQDGPGPASQKQITRGNSNSHNRAPSSSSSHDSTAANSGTIHRNSFNHRSRSKASGVDRHGFREDSPKRVDFSRAHHLREVKWDGTYQDSLAFPSSLADSTLTNSRDIRETDIRFLNFSRAPNGSEEITPSSSPYAPPPSLSESASTFSVHLPSSSSSGSSPLVSSNAPSASSSATSVHSQHHQPRHSHLHHHPPHHYNNQPQQQQQQNPPQLNDRGFQPRSNPYLHNSQKQTGHGHHSQPATDIRWNLDPPLTSTSSARWVGGTGHDGAVSMAAAAGGPKLTRVDFHTIGSGATGTSSDGSSRQQTSDFLMPRVHRQVEEKWTSHSVRSRNNLEGRDRRLADAGGRDVGGPSMDDWRGSSGDQGSDMGCGLGLDISSPKRPLNIKKPITADLKDNEIMLKLKERLKQQRNLAASSQSGSNDTSLVESNSSESTTVPPALPPRQPLSGNAFGGAVPKTRKVAAAHPSPCYRGFSDSTKDTALANKASAGTKVSSGKKKSGAGAKKSLQLQPKRHDGDDNKLASHHATTTALPPKKVTRVVATSSHVSGDKKHSKSGAKNIITTSSWRAGQELILRELGSANKVMSRSSQGDGQGSMDNRENEDNDLGARSREPDGAEMVSATSSAYGTRSVSQAAGPTVRRDPVTEEVMAKAKMLSEDARNMLNDLQLGPEITGSAPETRVKSAGGYKLAVKRKAPKVVESEKQPREKARHYDPDSVRKYMAKQKADRLKRQQEKKEAHLKANERREICMKELAGRQKKQAKASAQLARKMKDEGRRRKDVEANINGNKENVAMDIDNDDESTLTEDSEDDSTPQVTPRQGEGDFIQVKSQNKEVSSMPVVQEPPSSTTRDFIEFRGQRLNLDKESVLNRFSHVVNQRRGQGQNSTGHQLQDNPSILSNIHNRPREETTFSTASMARTNEERKQAIRATALTLQNRLAEETRKLGGVEWAKKPDPDTEFVSRYNRIAGNTADFQVFGSNLPGSHSQDAQREQQAAVHIQAAYRGHTVRQALNWELPSGQTFGQRIRGSPPGQELPDRNNNDNGEGSQLSDSSTFSEITATEPSDGMNLHAPMSMNKKSLQNSYKHKPTDSQPNRMPSNFIGDTGRYPDWSAPQSDPYSVMNIFSRQSKYRIAGSPDNDSQGPRPAPTTSSHTNTMPSSNPSTDAFVANLNLTSLKHPVISSEERVVIGQTSSGHPVVARARYTRMEATVSEDEPIDEVDAVLDHDDDDDYSEEESTSTLRDHSSGQGGQVTRQPSASRHISSSLRFVEGEHSKSKTMASIHDTQSIESDEEMSDNKMSHKHSTAKKSTVASYVRQISDTGQETDVSQMSEDEPRLARTKMKTSPQKHDTHASAMSTHQQESMPGQMHQPETRSAPKTTKPGRLSPNSLSNKMSASLNYLESVEESLRQTVGLERVRAVALAQQESVSLAQVLKARQQEHSADMHQLQLQAQQEALEAQRQLDQTTRKGHSTATLLEKEDNRRPESRSNLMSVSYSNSMKADKKSDLSQSPGNRRANRTSASASLASVTQVSSRTRSGRSHNTISSASIRTAEDSYNDSDSSIKTASDVDVHNSRTASVAEEIQEEESYSMSFDESFTDEESFRQVLPSESHRKELRRQSSGHSIQNSLEVSSHVTPYGDLSSLFAGEDSFNRFTADMVRQIMKEEEYRAQHQAALLSLREKALKEKAKAELAWLQQLKQQPRDKRADDMFPNLDKKEKIIRKNLQEQQAEIHKLQEANKLASMERQRLLQQHEEIAKIKENTQTTLQKLKSTKHKAEGRLARPPQVHTEDEIDEASDVSEDIKDSKSDSEMYQTKSPSKNPVDKEEQQMKEKIQKLHLDQKYMTAREQMLHDRKKHARELLEWKRRLDEEEQKVFNLEKKAMHAWKGKSPGSGKHGMPGDGRKEEAMPNKKANKIASASRKDDSNVISDHMLSSFRDETAAEAKHRAQVTEASISEVISTQIGGSRSETSTVEKKGRSRLEQKTPAKEFPRSPGASGSESSIPEDVQSGSQGDEKQKAQDSSDDTIINSSVNEDYADTFEHDGSGSVASRKKLPVGKLLPQGNSPLPSPWSRKAGSESESEDSISHTETLSDASDYEVRIRQLSDELRRRRKEVEILKKERSRRQKDKLKAQEEALKKQLDAYNNYILQLKSDKDNLEHDAAVSSKSVVRPQIKQPKSGHVKTRAGHRSDEAPNQSSSFEDMRDSTDSTQTSPSIEGKDLRLTPTEDKDKKKVSLMDRISEGSESLSDKSSDKIKGLKGKIDLTPSKSSKSDEISERTSSSSIAEAVEDASQLESLVSEKTASLRFQTGAPVKTRKVSESGKEDDASYSMDFSETTATLAQSHKGSLAPEMASRGRSEADISEHIEEASVASTKSPSVSQQLKFNFMSKSDSKMNEDSMGPLSPPTMGIQESDSETESRVNSYHTSVKSEGSSRPSSERSVGSMSYSAEDDEEEEDIISYSSDKTPTKGSPTKVLPPVSAAASKMTEEDISEHISASLPSISEKRTHSGSLRQDSQEMLNDLIDYKAEEEDDDDKTPVPTPREMELSHEKDKEDEEQGEDEEEENASLLMTDPLADFHLGDRVLVWGRKMGTLKFKGKVDFSPGIWAGVEIDDNDGDSDGLHEGKRYFSCPPGRGVMVHGSDISTEAEKDTAEAIIPKANEIHSPDESLTTDQEDSNIVDAVDASIEDRTFLSTPDVSMLHSTPISSPNLKGSSDGKILQPDATPVKEVNSTMADSITDHLTASILEDTMDTVGKIASKKTPPPTSPKPKKPAPTTVPASTKEEESLDPALKHITAADQTTDGVMDSLLNEAISHMMSIKKRQAGRAKASGLEAITSDVLVNGDIEGTLVTKSQKSTVQASKEVSHSLSRELGGGDFRDNEEKTGDSGTSVDPFKRPGSPIPGDSLTAEDHQELNDDLAGLLGEYIEDDFGMEATGTPGKPPPPYPGEGDSVMPADKGAIPEDIPSVVPRTKEEVAPIVAQIVDIFWTHRRYGESLDEVEPSEDFLCADEDKEQDTLSAQSCRSWRRMLFDLAREVIQEIYKDEERPETPVWQKAQHFSQKYFKGGTLPTTIDSLRPVVQSAVFDLMDMNGNRKNNTVNKWNIRKKKDAVDAVLVQELGEEERGWVNYNHDELNLKMNLTNSIFESLLSDTVHTLNGIYQRKSQSHV